MSGKLLLKPVSMRPKFHFAYSFEGSFSLLSCSFSLRRSDPIALHAIKLLEILLRGKDDSTISGAILNPSLRLSFSCKS